MSHLLSEIGFDLSVGNLDMAHRIYRDAQRLVIGSGDERITDAVLEQAYATACGLSSKTEEVQEQRNQNALPRRSQKQCHVTSDLSRPLAKKASIIGDITRAQHPEFEFKLREIQLAIDLADQIQDSSLFQRAAGLDNPIEYLRAEGAMCDDPLKQFA